MKINETLKEQRSLRFFPWEWRARRPSQRLSGRSETTPGKRPASHSITWISSQHGVLTRSPPFYVVNNRTLEQELAFSLALVPVTGADAESLNTRCRAFNLLLPSREGPPSPASWLCQHDPDTHACTSAHQNCTVLVDTRCPPAWKTSEQVQRPLRAP